MSNFGNERRLCTSWVSELLILRLQVWRGSKFAWEGAVVGFLPSYLFNFDEILQGGDPLSPVECLSVCLWSNSGSWEALGPHPAAGYCVVNGESEGIGPHLLRDFDRSVPHPKLDQIGHSYPIRLSRKTATDLLTLRPATIW